MLINSPVTAYMYKIGYVGVEDIYDYWCDNKDRISNGYRLKYKRRDTEDDLKSFRLKVRWASYYGFSIRMVIERMLRTHKGQEMDFKVINGSFRDPAKGIDHFSETTLEASDRVYDHCLQGISIINRQMVGTTFKDVDFSYAAFDGTVMNGVRFINCNFHRTSFRGARLEACRFDKDCITTDNDFRKTLIDARFDCTLHGPITNEPSWLGRTLGQQSPKKKYLDYTRVTDPSFFDGCV